jgi:hypothetical protein
MKRLTTAWVTLAAPLAWLAAASLFPCRPADAVAQWTDPIVLVSSDKGSVGNPVLVADPENTVHLLFADSQSSTAASSDIGDLGAAGLPESPAVLMYSRLQDGRWSIPIDTLTASDGAGVGQHGVTLDPRGYLHVIWKHGALGELEYSRVHVSRAAAGPSQWTSPIQLSHGGLAPGGFGAPAAITVSQDGMLHVVYAAREGGILYRRSDDGGRSWISPVTVVGKGGPESMPDLPRIAVGGQGRLLVTWTQFRFPQGWPPVGTFSSTSVDDGQNWAEPVRIIGPDYGQVSMTTIEPNIVHRVWNGIARVGERRHQWSADGGQTWTSSTRIVPPALRGGFTGYPALAVDSAGVLHLATSVGPIPGYATTEIVYHLQWDGSRWTDPVYISKDAVGKRQVDSPVIAVSEGNRLHVAYQDDQKRIWYTSRLLDAPTVPARPVPPPPAPATMELSPSPTTLAAPRAVRIIGPADIQAEFNPGAPLLAGVVPSLVLGAIVLFRVTRRG